MDDEVAALVVDNGSGEFNRDLLLWLIDNESLSMT